MSTKPSAPLILPLDSAAGIAELGGKGASLARLAAAGLPVPRGFHITTEGYRRFVGEAGLRERIAAAASRAEAARPEALDEAARQIAELFAQHAMSAAAAAAIGEAYAALGEGDPPVAVRSSATAEDLPEMSVAGQHESYLNVRGEAMLVDAVKRCWASLWTARAIDYRSRRGIAPGEVDLAVVVQELVPADAAGVLFTADPLTGEAGRVHINAAWGLGEAIVGGQVTPDMIVVDSATGAIAEQIVADKAVMTACAAEGTCVLEVPAERRTAAVLSATEAAGLARMGAQIDDLYGRPMDVEWARAGGRFYVLQARPITGIRAPAAAIEEWGHRPMGDELWTSTNLGEAIPGVMTPCTDSLVKRFVSSMTIGEMVAGRRLYANIAGRFYMNLSLIATLTAMFGSKRRYADATEQIFGRLPEGMDIPLIPLSRFRVLREVMLKGIYNALRRRRNGKKLRAFLQAAPARCDELRARISAATEARGLLHLWQAELEPFFVEACRMLQAANQQDNPELADFRRELREKLGEADANTVMTGAHSEASALESLGPLLGLAALARGEIDRATYAERYGHRSPHEFEVSIRRPAEDPSWIDKQLEGLRGGQDPRALLDRQEAARAGAWERLRQLDPGGVDALRGKVDRWSAAARDREAARSEVVRVFWALRTFVLRAGALTEYGDDLFFLSIDEIALVLGGHSAPLARVATRRATYDRYRSLPTYPVLIRGPFDPFRWAADPHRRSDVFDGDGARAPISDAITGFPGAAGVVEGPVRVVAAVEDGDLLQAGEILVTTVTNVGWTPLFPRASAIVTDVGAPLSHAAIVARELGIPAVVGCGNAMMRLRTGDRVRVDGAQGTVTVLEARDSPIAST